MAWADLFVDAVEGGVSLGFEEGGGGGMYPLMPIVKQVWEVWMQIKMI